MDHKNHKALIARISRALAHQGEALRTSRSQRDVLDLGLHYIVNDRGTVIGKHIDLEALAARLGVTQPRLTTSQLTAILTAPATDGTPRAKPGEMYTSMRWPTYRRPAAGVSA